MLISFKDVVDLAAPKTHTKKFFFLENSDMSRHYLKISIIFHRKVKCKIISSKDAKKQYRMVKNKVFNYENSKASNV